MHKRLLFVAVLGAAAGVAQLAFAGDTSNQHVVWGVTHVTPHDDYTLTPDPRQGTPIRDFQKENAALMRGNQEFPPWRLYHAFITQPGVGFTKQKAGIDYNRDVRPEVRAKRHALAT